MAEPSDIAIPPPTDWQRFERITRDLFAAEWGTAELHGRTGQAQHGVDRYGKPHGASGWHGVQCKHHDSLAGKTITADDLRIAVDDAKKFRPALSQLILACTGPRDAGLQALVREINDTHEAAGLFSVAIAFWPDFLDMYDRHRRLLEEHYKGLVPFSAHPSCGSSHDGSTADSAWTVVSSDTLRAAVDRAANYLINDQLRQGIGVGGWGISDKTYMTDLYGPDAGKQTEDSVMTSVAVIKGLQAYSDLSRQSATSRPAAGHMWETLNTAFEPYLDARWDAATGWGGTLKYDREGTRRMAPSCRHTAWLLDLWMALPGYQWRIPKTVDCLIAMVDRTDWKSEKVATPVAVHAALSRLLSSPFPLDAKTREAVGSRVEIAADQIVAQYMDAISGWTSGPSATNGRQTYTWFVLAEMAHAWGTTGRLPAYMQEALAASFEPPWWVPDVKGIARIPGGQMHLAISALAASALARLPNPAKQQAARRGDVVRSVVNVLTGNDVDALAGTCSWALAYFVMDAANDLGKRSA